MQLRALGLGNQHATGIRAQIERGIKIGRIGPRDGRGAPFFRRGMRHHKGHDGRGTGERIATAFALARHCGPPKSQVAFSVATAARAHNDDGNATGQN
jgi:hypothetical protein